MVLLLILLNIISYAQPFEDYIFNNIYFPSNRNHDDLNLQQWLNELIIDLPNDLIINETKGIIQDLTFCTAGDNTGHPGRQPYLWTLFGVDENGKYHAVVTGDGTTFNRNAGNNVYYPVRIGNAGVFQTYSLIVWGTPSGCFQMADVILCTGGK